MVMVNLNFSVWTFWLAEVEAEIEIDTFQLFLGLTLYIPVLKPFLRKLQMTAFCVILS